LYVLLAEDNPVNQRVTSGILEKRGHHVEIANNGRDALRLLELQQFDIVLMDVQMPIIDGLEATAIVRRRERTSGRYTPIIALTARAMTGDRDCCLDAGMDDYVSKPIQPKELLAAIERVLEKWAARMDQDCSDPPIETILTPIAAIEDGPPENSIQLSDDMPAVDIAELHARVENDFDMLDDMLRLFLDTAPELLSSIDASIVSGDHGQLGKSAHALKGAMQSISANRAAQAALALERLDGATATQVADRFSELRREYKQLEVALQQMISEMSENSGLSKYSDVCGSST
jgi:two-component system sensor histidine kinase/response regulator